jgi:titin
VSARNKKGYSLPNKDEDSVAPMIVPAAPTGVTLEVISATQLRVMFGSPSDNGGDTITKYLIEWSTSSDFSNAESSTHEYLAGGSPFFKNIEGLSTGVYYYVRVRAKNSQGYGISQSSTPSSLNPHQKPSPPTNVRLGVTSNSMLTIGWSPPLSDGGDSIAKYRIEWDTNPRFVSASHPPNKGYVDLGPLSRSYTVDLLSPEKSYYLRVYAINAAGSSQAQTSDPSWAFPRVQIPGAPHSLVCRPGDSTGIIKFSWQRPNVPNHGIPCFGNKDCPAPYGGSLPQTDGGEDISEYELEVNERPDYTGSDKKLITLPGLHTNVANLYPGRLYYARVLARNSVGSGRYSPSVSCIVPL